MLPMSEKRRKAYALGVEAEKLASKMLVSRGWEVEATRYKTKAGEVDLIARQQNLIIFVEVKARSNQITALESVSEKSKARIKAAGLEWLLEQDDHPMLSWRCDLIVVTPDGEPLHIEGAW